MIPFWKNKVRRPWVCMCVRVNIHEPGEKKGRIHIALGKKLSLESSVGAPKKFQNETAL